MMRWDPRFVLSGLAGGMLATSGALGQDAVLRVGPDAGIAVPGNPTRGFDAPAPLLTLDLSGRAAVAGLAPGQDLRGSAAPTELRLSAADTDSYLNSKDYQQILSHYFPKKSPSAGQQFSGLGKAAVTALVREAKHEVVDSLKQEVDDRIDAGALPPVTALGLEALSDVTELGVALKPLTK